MPVVLGRQRGETPGGQRTMSSPFITEAPAVVLLDGSHMDAGLVGSKAANLARARAEGLAVVDGFVIPPILVALLCSASPDDMTRGWEQLRDPWDTLSGGGSEPVVVRSSARSEDTEHSSQAGVYESVIDVTGWDRFLEAVRFVATSGPDGGSTAPSTLNPVLVQRHLEPDLGGVLFTVDPVTGRSDHLAVSVVRGGPQALVGGSESGTSVLLDRRAGVVEGDRAVLTRRQRIALVRLATRAARLFGGPQDIEWAMTRTGHLVLLQSRPITSVAPRAHGAVFGPGPVAETFPEPLAPLEQDLWLTPLREALRVVLTLTGGASQRAIEESPLVVAVGGRAAIDLDLLDGDRRPRRGLAALDPRVRIRRLRVAWRLGRLRAGLPGLVEDVVARLDADLADVPALDSLDADPLLDLLERGRASLRAAHGYELLAATLTEQASDGGASLALDALRLGRQRDLSDAEIIAAHPTVLALVPPTIVGTVELPVVPLESPVMADHLDARLVELPAREALRLRIRWLHELTARAARVLGERLCASGQVRQPGAISGVDLRALRMAVRHGTTLEPVPPALVGPPLPARFQLTPEGSPVAVRRGPSEGVGAGGGRGSGIVAHGPRPAPGSVLVVDALDPRLAPVLEGLGGLVASTGSPLSHLAILARERGVPTVVGVADALSRFPPGTHLLLDGTSGEIRVLHPAPTAPAGG